MKVTLRGLLSRLAALALTTSTIGSAAADDERLADELEHECRIEHDHADTHEAAHALGRGLAIALAEMRPLSATHIAATWALSADPLRRLAIGVALEWTFPLVGDDFVIDYLAFDPDPAIRIAAARAAWVRRPAGGDPGVLDRLADDPDPDVRLVARGARWPG